MKDPRIGTVLDGYRIDEKLGEGGMGIVYRAHHLRLRRDVALKLVRPELAHDQAFRRRFDREIQLAASIQHANLVTVHDAAETVDGDVYLTMQLIEGQDLGSMLSDSGPLAPARATRIVMQVARALDEAHAAGLVHRDVKPSNILVCEREGREHAYLTDFGIAKRVTTDAGLTRREAFVGTIGYAAPEQIRGAPVDARCDVYSLACVLFRMVAGRDPFVADSDWDVMRAHEASARPRISDIGSLPATAKVVASLDAVIARGMAIEPEQRYASTGDLGRAALSVAEGRPEPVPAGSVARGAAAPSDPPARGPAEVAGERRGWPRGRARLAVAGAFVAAVAAGALLARAGEQPSSPVKSHRLSTASLSLEVPARWRHVEQRQLLAGVAFADALRVTALDASGPTIVAGMVHGVEDPSLLPRSTLAIDERLPRPQVVALGALHALRYGGVRLTGVGVPTTLYAVPTDRGVATVACLAAADRATRCDEVAATLRLRKPHAFAPGPGAALAGELNDVTRAIARAQRRYGVALRDARRPEGQASTAASMRRAYAQAARSIGALSVGPADARPVRRLAAGLRDARDAYGDLATAARSDDARSFRRARRSITRALRRIDEAIASFADSGYATR